MSNLVFDKNTGELLGFTDLSDTDISFCAVEEMTNAATHALAFIVRSFCTEMNFCLAHLATTGVFLRTAFGNFLGCCVYSKNKLQPFGSFQLHQMVLPQIAFIECTSSLMGMEIHKCAIVPLTSLHATGFCTPFQMLHT